MTPRPPWALDRLTLRPWAQTRMAHPPGISPMDPADWLLRNETYGAQMALRDDLAAGRPDAVIACLPEGRAAAAELLAMAADYVIARQGARRIGGAIIRADGVRVPLSGPPMDAVCRLAQEDMLILARPEGQAEHVLVAGALCFPANWMLQEKIGKALLRIHRPVREYGDRLASRVQRLHDGVAAGRPLCRANWNFAPGPDLFTPDGEADKTDRHRTRAGAADWRDCWIRVERQTLSRLPQSGAVVFAIHSMVAPLIGCTDEDWREFHRAFMEMPEAVRADKAGAAILAEAARRAQA